MSWPETAFEKAIEDIKPLAIRDDRGPEYEHLIETIYYEWDQDYVDRLNFLVVPGMHEKIQEGDLYIWLVINSNFTCFYHILNKYSIMEAMFNERDPELS